ncbi:LysM peptidoglycan-binding domain-containing protein [Arthrobacter crusticola]|uniref:LysM peptidoglycan-binding domain-containing protein n=1 Tax=Arthrobacter crusticola TaxID=2547960 RepID=A0A4R5TPT1_9MICC|nr:lytic transglycosylase domain-containing protein [Arthrobacter crusticola]TDK24198.1 LysM peptidoglycan-binding domain-containing protein [Arthrobacter crusticola]
MTAQPPSTPLSGASRRAAGTSSSRRRNLAVSTAAIPAVILSSVALAESAAAHQPAPATSVRLQVPTVQASPARALIPAAEVAARVPALKVPAVTTPAAYTIKAGDTMGAIARKHGIELGALLKLNRMSPTTVIYPGQKIRLVTGSTPAPAAPAAVRAQTTGSYVVKPGDTLGAIASRHGVSLDSLLKANNLSMTSIIHPGQKIVVGGKTAVKPSAPAPAKPAPAAPAASYVVKPGDTLGAIASRHGVSLDSLLKANNLSMTSVIHPGQKLVLSGKPAAPAPAAPTAPTAPAGSYTIKAGDTLGAIAARHGVSLAALLQANNLQASTVIYPGKKLTIPTGNGGSPTAPPPTNLVPSTFLGVTYPQAVVADANRNKQILNSLPAPSPAQMRTIVANTARSMGVDPSLAMAFAFQESGFNQRAVSPANAIGTMQVIPMSGQWASDLVGRKLNLLNPQDNVTAGVAIIRSLLATSPSQDIAIASYYQGQYSVKTHGMFSDTKNYVAAIKAHQKNFR